MKTLIDFDSAVVVAIPVTAGFGEPGERECMLLEGPQGWGEFSPPRDVDDQHAVRWLTAATEPGTVAWPDPVRGRIPAAVDVPVVSPAQAHDLVLASGCRTAEVTVGGSVTADAARLAAVRDALGADGLIRIAAAGIWDVDAAVSAIAALARAAAGLEYVEQPCRTLDEMAAVRRAADVPIAADASLVDSPNEMTEVVDVAVLPVSALGGVRRSLRIAEMSGLPCVVRAGRQTSVGLAAAVALAGALPELPFACAVGRPPWVAGDVVAAGRSLVPVDGHLPVASMPPGPDPGLLIRYAITDPDTRAWWRQRLERVRSFQ